ARAPLPLGVDSTARHERMRGAYHATSTPHPPPSWGSRSESRAFAVGTGLFLLGGVGVWITQASLYGPTAKNDPWLRLALLILSAIVWAAGCRLSARAWPIRWVADWPICPPAVKAAGFNSRQLFMAVAALAFGVIAAGLWWVGRFETAVATLGMLFWLVALVL